MVNIVPDLGPEGNHQVRKLGQDHSAGQFHIGAIAIKWVMFEVGVHVLESIGLFHENSEGFFSNSQSPISAETQSSCATMLLAKKNKKIKYC